MFMKSSRTIRNTILLIGAVLINFLYFPMTQAAALTAISDTVSRMEAGIAANHTFRFTTPTGVTAGQTITVTFPAGFNMSTIVFGDVDFSYGATGTETDATLAANPSGTTWGAAVAGQVLTITSGTGTVAAGNKVIIEIGTHALLGGAGTHQITNHATPATYLITIGGTMADTAKLAIVVLADDQVSVTATVDPSLTFTLSANASSFGLMTTGAIATGGTNIDLTVGTNALSGYILTVQDQGNGTNGGLYNAGTNTTILSNNATLAAGTEGYGIQAASQGGSPTISGTYLVSGNVVGQLTVAAQTLASNAASMATNDVIRITHKAAISASSKPGSYLDTITYLVTARY